MLNIQASIVAISLETSKGQAAGAEYNQLVLTTV
jgi:hypothetical protein